MSSGDSTRFLTSVDLNLSSVIVALLSILLILLLSAAVAITIRHHQHASRQKKKRVTVVQSFANEEREALFSAHQQPQHDD